MYSKDDVEEILSELMTSVRDSVKRDLEATTSMSALVLEQVLSAADDGGVSVAVDMSNTEDSGSISRIRDLASAAGIGALGDLDVKRKNVVKLVRPAYGSVTSVPELASGVQQAHARACGACSAQARQLANRAPIRWARHLEHATCARVACPPSTRNLPHLPLLV